MPKLGHPILTLLTLIATLLLNGNAQAQVVSETLIFLEPDGHNFLRQRVIRSDFKRHRFHVDKTLQPNDLSYVDPNEFEWDSSSDPKNNILTFNQGSYTIIHPGKFSRSELTQDTQGVMTYRSWDGYTRPDGHYGMWHEPGNYDRFNYAWLLPANLELIDYRSNRPGNWVKRKSTLTFFAEKVNDLTFVIRYRERDNDNDGVSNSRDLCRATPPNTPVDEIGCPIKIAIHLKGVNFHHDSAELTRDSLLILNRLSVTLLKHPDLSLEIAGHTDAKGNQEYNIELSQRRAESVLRYLRQQGVSSPLIAQGYGKSRPLADNHSETGRAKNRRVELKRLN
ncbi:MAG: OmpA family protein [Gammaproteobacteria bacterium]|nr:OmpA family protein [Gammaproteobacteria bacterium]